MVAIRIPSFGCAELRPAGGLRLTRRFPRFGYQIVNVSASRRAEPRRQAESFEKSGRDCDCGSIGHNFGGERAPRGLAVLVTDRAAHGRDRREQDRRVVHEADAHDEIGHDVEGRHEIGERGDERQPRAVGVVGSSMA